MSKRWSIVQGLALLRKHQRHPPPAVCTPVQSGGFSLWLPWPPSLNELYRAGEKPGYKHLTDRQLAFRNDVAAIVRINRVTSYINTLSYHVDLYPGKAWRGDGDNHAFKAIWDALQFSGAIANDSQFKQFSGTVHPAVSEAGAHILVKALHHAG